MSVNLVVHVRIKHVEIDYHFLRERVASVFFAPTRYRVVKIACSYSEVVL
jgi:hypothetical protein